MTKRGDQPLLTLAQYEQAKANVVALKKEIAELNQQLTEEQDLVNIGEKLLKRHAATSEDNVAGNVQASSVAQVGRRARATWTSEIERIVSDRKIISYPSLKDEISRGPLKEKMERSDKGFYGALGKLEDRGVLVRYRDHAFTVKAFQDYEKEVQAGVRDPIYSESSSRSSPLSDAICNFLRHKPEGAVSGEIIDHLGQNPEFRGMVSKQSSTLYNTLARLVSRAILTKDDDTKIYRFGAGPNEIGSAEAEPSESGGVDACAWQQASSPQADGLIPSTPAQISQTVSELPLSYCLVSNPIRARQRERRLV